MCASRCDRRWVTCDGDCDGVCACVCVFGFSCSPLFILTSLQTDAGIRLFNHDAARGMAQLLAQGCVADDAESITTFMFGSAEGQRERGRGEEHGLAGLSASSSAAVAAVAAGGGSEGGRKRSGPVRAAGGTSEPASHIADVAAAAAAAQANGCNGLKMQKPASTA